MIGLGYDLDLAIAALEQFGGTKRRFELKGTAAASPSTTTTRTTLPRPRPRSPARAPWSATAA